MSEIYLIIKSPFIWFENEEKEMVVDWADGKSDQVNAVA